MSTPAWRTTPFTVLKAVPIEPQHGMEQDGDRLRFGPGKGISVAGRRYQLTGTYAVDGKTYEVSFPMICDVVPETLTLAYDPTDPAKWDWPEDRTLETD